MLLLREGGFDRAIFEGFLVYLISHNRPIAEILDPDFKDLKEDFEREFIELPEEPVTLEELEATRDHLVRQIRRLMTGKDKMFLLSIKRGEPKWNMLGIRGIEALPAVQWKLQNIAAMPKARHAEALERLEGILSDFT